VSKRRSVQQPDLELDDRPRRRRRPTFAEAVLARGIPVPSEEYTFAILAGRQWRFDYCWPPYRVAYEYEGGTWVGGRHVSGSGVDGDCEKYNRAQILGWIVIRGTASTERSGQALDDLEDALISRGWKEPT
jgi:hypothetical protein